MSQLSMNWFLEGIQDFEHKKYLLLGYLQWARKRFDETELYPALSQLVEHYHNLTNFYEHLTELQEQFPRQLHGIDLEKFELQYRSLMEDDDRLSEVEDIVEYALPQVKKRLDEGREIFEFIERCIEIGEVGLLPLNRESGYFLLRGGDSPEVKAFQFQVTVFEHAREKYRSIQTQFVGSFTHSITNTFQSIKLSLIRTRRDLPNPATFFIRSTLEFPEQHALVPVAKRKFMRHLAEMDKLA